MSFRQKSIGRIEDFLPTVDEENIEESLEKIRQSAREYYVWKKGDWKPEPKIAFVAETYWDELPTSSPTPPSLGDLKEYQKKLLSGDWEDKLRVEMKPSYRYYDEWVDHRPKLGEGKNPMAEHTIRKMKPPRSR